MGMTHDLSGFGLHPSGEPSAVADQGPPRGVLVDSFTRPVHVEWDREAAFTPLGQLPFLIDFLKTAGLFDAVLDESPAKGRRAATSCTVVIASNICGVEACIPMLLPKP